MCVCERERDLEGEEDGARELARGERESRVARVDAALLDERDNRLRALQSRGLGFRVERHLLDVLRDCVGDHLFQAGSGFIWGFILRFLFIGGQRAASPEWTPPCSMTGYEPPARCASGGGVWIGVGCRV